MKGDEDKHHEDSNQEGSGRLPKLIFPYWTPTFAAASIFALTSILISYGRRGHHPLNEEEETHYLDQLYSVIQAIELGFLSMVFLGNAAYGAKPDISDHHNPPNHRLGQTFEGALPWILAGGHSIFNFVLGNRAKAIDPLLSPLLAGSGAVARADMVDGELYSDTMDRSLLLDGNVRRIEYGAILWQRAVTYIGELTGYYLIFAMERGMTRLSITDDNRLYVHAGLYSSLTLIENVLVYPVDAYAYYLERFIDDVTPLGWVLRATGIADPEHPVHAVDKSTMDKFNEKFAKAAKKGKEEIKDAVHKVGDAIEDVGHGIAEIGHNIMHAFHLGDHHHNQPHTVDPGDGGGKPTAEELKEMEEEQEEGNGGSGILSNLFAAATGNYIPLHTQTNGSHSADFSEATGRVFINSLQPNTILCIDGMSQGSRVIIKVDGICYECRHVSEIHHAGSLGYVSQHHRELGDVNNNHEVHSYQPVNHQYVLMRVDGCDTAEMRVYGADFNMDGSSGFFI